MKKEEFIASKPYLFSEKIIMEVMNKEYQQLLEGMINSYDVETCITYLHSQQPFIERCRVQKVNGNNIFNLMVFGVFIKQFEYILEKIDDYLGWIPAQMIVMDTDEFVNNINQANYLYNKSNPIYTGKFSWNILDDISRKKSTMICVFQMERKFAKKTTSELRKRKKNLELPRKIYHITYKENVDGIKKYGFQPKTINKVYEYPDRIYFFTDKKMAESASMFKILKMNDTQKVLITLDTDKIGGKKKRGVLPDKEIIWYEDPNFITAVYTTSSITSNAIIDIEDIIEY